MSHFDAIIQNFSKARITIIGDIMLDKFMYGDVSRISPEGPIPVLAINKEKEMLGGAGNVYANLCALGVAPAIITLIGKDDQGKKITDIAKQQIGHVDFVSHATRPTTVKTRYIAQNQQLLRVDQEDHQSIDEKTQKDILAKAKKRLKKSDVLILSDYNKGVLTPSLIRQLIDEANAQNVKVIIDPKGNNYTMYQGAYLVTPNKSELGEATSTKDLHNDALVEQAAKKIMRECGIKNVIATRSAEGMSVIDQAGNVGHFKTQAQEVYDVSGAGDTVIAVIAAAVSVEASLEDAAQIANKAGGLVVAKLGTATVSAEELIKGPDAKNQSLEFYEEWNRAKDIITHWQDQNLKVGFTNGCFDILHHGHVSYLAQAKKRCDRLVLGLNHDKSVKILKGEKRPINDAMARASVMKALDSVDMVVLFGAEKADQDNTPSEVIRVLKPDVIFKGGDYTVDQLPEAQVVLSYGGEVDIMPLYEGYSTTNIIKKSSAA